MKLWSFRSFATLTCAFALSAVGHSQSGPALREALSVMVVEIPVTVVGRNGEPIRGLQSEKFELLIDGKQRVITHFEVIDLKASGANVSSTPPHPASRRNFMLLFDLTFSTPSAIGRGRAAALQFVRQQMSPGDLCSVASYSVDLGFQILSAFTDERVLLEQALAAVGSPSQFRPRDPLHIAARYEGMDGLQASPFDREMTDASVKAAVEELLREEIEEHQRESERAADAFYRERIHRQIDNLSQLARSLDAIQGRKQVILLSEGFDARYVRGRDSGISKESAKDASNIQSGELWKVDNDQRFGSAESHVFFQKMGNLFKRSDVVLHTFDLKGIRAGVDARLGTESRSNEGLFMLAEPTGGKLYDNANRMNENFDRMLRQQEVVYLLGFRAADEGGKNRYHNVSVKVRERGARVSHRTGYWESRDSSELGRVLSAADILIKDIPQEGLSLSVLAIPFPQRGAAATIPIIVDIDGKELLGKLSKRGVSSLEVFIYAFDERRIVRDFRYQLVALDIDRVDDVLANGPLRYFGALTLPAGSYSVKTLIRVTGSTAAGFHTASLRVPAQDESIILPPLFFEESRPALVVKERSESTSRADAMFTFDGVVKIPLASPLIDVAVRQDLVLFAYGVPADAMRLTGTVRDEHGTSRPASVRLTGRREPADDGRAELLLSFDASGLNAGRYLFELKSEVSGQIVTAPFTVRR